MFKREPLHEPLSDELRNLRQRGDGFRLPDNYLDSLKQRVPASAAPPPPAGRTLWVSSRATWLAIAATVALLLAVGGAWLYAPATPSAADPILAEADLAVLSDEEILAYVEDNIADFEFSLLYEDATDAATETTPATETLSDEELDELYYELLE